MLGRLIIGIFVFFFNPLCAAIAAPTGGLVAANPAVLAAPAEAAYQNGVELFKAKKYEQALVFFEAALRLDPNAKVLEYNVARCYDELPDLKKRVEVWESFFEKYPDDPDGAKRLTEARQAKAKADADAKERAERLARAKAPPLPAPTTGVALLRVAAQAAETEGKTSNHGKVFLVGDTPGPEFPIAVSRLEGGVTLPFNLELSPGRYTANGVPFEVKVGEKVEVEIVLQQDPDNLTTDDDSTDTPAFYQRWPPWYTWVLAAAGGVGLGLGTYFGDEATWGDGAARNFREYPEAAKEYQAYADQSRTGAYVSYALGGAALAGAVATWVWAPDDGPTLTPTPVGKDGAGAVLTIPW